MSVRNASSSIYCDYIDAQKWSLVSVNKTPQAELCSSLSKARLYVIDQELLQCLTSSPCIGYNKIFFLELNESVKMLLTHFTLVLMGLLAVSYLGRLRDRMIHKAPLTRHTSGLTLPSQESHYVISWKMFSRPRVQLFSQKQPVRPFRDTHRLPRYDVTPEILQIFQPSAVITLVRMRDRILPSPLYPWANSLPSLGLLGSNQPRSQA